MTEIEVYDTDKPADPVTGKRPLKARIRTGVRQTLKSNETATMKAEEKAETKAEAEVERLDTQSDEVTVTGRSPAPGFWERAKVAVQTAAVLMILAAAGWVIYKFIKHIKI